MYSDHYGLSGRPFQLTPDPAFYFDSQTHRKAMAYLGYGLAQGEGFIVITGDIGAGKTTLVGHLMATIDRSRLTAVRLVSTQVDGDDILRLAAQGLGLSTEGMAKAQLLARFERFLQDEARAGKHVLLIVDEAQNLSNSALEELRMLSNFQSGGQSMLQIFLLGQPEFRDRLQQDASLEQLRQRVIATHHLDPMKADEVGPYIRHRLELVGWNGNPAFDQTTFDALFRHSRGVPRLLNTVAGRAMLMAAVEKRGAIDGAVIDAAAADMAADAPAADAKHAERTPVPFARAERPDPALLDRLTALEARIEEQDAALRRVLTLLVDWVEGEGSPRGRDKYRHTA